MPASSFRADGLTLAPAQSAVTGETVYGGQDAVYSYDNFDDGASVVLSGGRSAQFGNAPGKAVLRAVEGDGSVIGEATWDGQTLALPDVAHHNRLKGVRVGQGVHVLAINNAHYIIGVNVSGTWMCSREVFTPAAITLSSGQNNYSPTNVSANYHATVTTPVTVTGWATPTDTSSTALPGTRVRVLNLSANNLTFAHQSSSSSANNRFQGTSGADVVIGQYEAAELEYVGSPLVCWRVRKL